jgi:hypothetical protein
MIGKTVSHYGIQEKLRGGMGEVYWIKLMRLDKIAALKAGNKDKFNED